MRSGQLVVMAACTALGGLAGYALRGGGAPVRAESRETARVIPIPVAGPAAGPSAAEMRALIREELAQRPAAGASAPATEAAQPAQPAPEALAALARADGQLDDASARGVWHAEDAAALRALLVDVPDSERARLMGRLAQALNDGVLRMDPGINPL